MKREVTRQKKLPAFGLGLGDLEALWSRVSDLFETPDDVYARLEIRLPTEVLTFKNIEELKQWQNPPAKVTKFSLWFSQGQRNISIRSSLFFGLQPEVRAGGDTEAWCAGAVDATYSFLNTNRFWYSWFAVTPIGWLLLLCVYIPTILLWFSPKGAHTSRPTLVAWLVVIALLTVLFIFKNFLLPSTVLVLTHTDSFLRRHAAELTLAVAVLSLILTVVGWFVGR